MKFHKAPPNRFYDDNYCTDRFESETGKWSIFLSPTLYGVRVNVSETNSPFYSLSVCCGSKPADIFVVYSTVKIWVSQFDESVLPGELENNFPVFFIKPVVNNPEWQDFVEQVLAQSAVT